MTVSTVQPWMEDGLCRINGVDPELFFTDNRRERKEMQAFCDGCEVKAACLSYSLRSGEQFGIWGGVDAPERRKLLKKKA